MSDNLPANVIEIIDLSDDDDVVFVESPSPPPPPATESIASTPTGLKYHLECGCPRCMDRKSSSVETIAGTNSQPPSPPQQQQQPQGSDLPAAANSVSLSLSVSRSASDSERQSDTQSVTNVDNVKVAAEALLQLQYHLTQHNSSSSSTTEQLDHLTGTGNAQQQQQHQQQGTTENPVPDPANTTLPAQQQQQQQNQDGGAGSSLAGNEQQRMNGQIVIVQNEDVEMEDDDQSPDMVYHRRLSAALSAAVTALDTSSSSTELVNSVIDGQPAVCGCVPLCENDGTNVVPLGSNAESNCVAHLVQHSRRRLVLKHKRAPRIRQSHLDLTKRGHRVGTRMAKRRMHRCHYPGCFATFAHKYYLMRHRRVHTGEHIGPCHRRPSASRVPSCGNDKTKSDHVSHLSNSTDHHHESLSSNAHVGSCHSSETNGGGGDPEDLDSGAMDLDQEGADCADTTDLPPPPEAESIVTTPEGLRYHRDCGCPRCICIIRSAI